MLFYQKIFSFLPPYQDLSVQLKSAPDNSLLHNLVTALVMVNMHHGGLRGVAQLWQEFVLEMRYRWENKYLISGSVSTQSYQGSGFYICHVCEMLSIVVSYFVCFDHYSINPGSPNLGTCLLYQKLQVSN